MTQIQNEEIRRPSTLFALSEFPRALIELSSLPIAAPLLRQAPRGDGHPVLVLPGFVTSDRSTQLLRLYLEDLGYEAHGWELGRNLGPKAIGARGERLTRRLLAIHRATRSKVSLVGWSLGGVMARDLARQAPHAVRQVITMGSPFTGNPHASTVSGLYERLTGEVLDSEQMAERLAAGSLPPPVPSTAIYSRSDGIVPWRNCVEPPSAQTDNIEVCGSHCGLGVNPAVLFAVADRLAQPEGGWLPFRRDSWRAAVYPSSGHLH
jgi:pimeloyl-ACP methyl ester carboxylesterase